MLYNTKRVRYLTRIRQVSEMVCESRGILTGGSILKRRKVNNRPSVKYRVVTEIMSVSQCMVIQSNPVIKSDLPF